jgi:iron complex transport system substrate-binding protein
MIRCLWSRWLLWVVLGVPLGSAAAVSVPDHRGTTLTLAASPQRIITLMPSLTESVCALGACARLVGTDRFSNSPPQVLALPKLGGIEDAQIERIVALKPDVVLAAPSSRVIDRLEQLGVKVLVIDSNNHADVRKGLATIALLLGAPDGAARIWAAIERDIARAAARVPPSLRGKRIYFEVDGGHYAAGMSSFIGETLGRMGMGNIVSPELGPFPKLNPEFVVRSQPDIVIASRRHVAQMPGRPGWSVMKALQDGRSCGFEPERYEVLIRPGPRMGEAAQLLADCLAGLDVPR